MSKGNKRRPKAISDDEFAKNCDYIFRNNSQPIEVQAEITGTLEATREGAEVEYGSEVESKESAIR